MPRKTLAPGGAGGRGPVASMRPRPDAAENREGYRLGFFGDPASMRPRPDAAENAAALREAAAVTKLQ